MKRTKRLFLISSIACVLQISACGGGGTTPQVQPVPSAIVGGKVSGLPQGVTILLVNNGTNIIHVSANGDFAFDRSVQASASYSVTMFAEPTGAHCDISGGTGTVNIKGESVSSIAVNCQLAGVALQAYNVAVSVSGLAQVGTAKFINNGTDSLSVVGNGLFVFPKSYIAQMSPPGGTYSVTVGENPTGQVCTLSNATGENIGPNFRNVVLVTSTCK